jgi:ABC-2 type transport system ATP-binding protein
MNTPALEIHGLRKTYSKNLEALKGIDLCVEQGDFFGLLGPNGAGKSTTIGIVSSLVNKTAGSIKIFGHDLELDPYTAKTFIGLVPQEFNFNVFEKVIDILIHQAGYYGIPSKAARRRAEEVLVELGLSDKAHVPARNLSGGMKRRLLIARGLVHQPKLLILDEPTAGVDIELRRGMWAYLEKINQQGVTIILTTHYLEEAEHLCKNIAIINHGEIIENTSVDSLIDKLQQETIILDLGDPLKQTLQIPNFELNQRSDTTLEVTYTRGQDLNDLFIYLREHSCSVKSMRNKANRLEEQFLRLVSKEVP